MSSLTSLLGGAPTRVEPPIPTVNDRRAVDRSALAFASSLDSARRAAPSQRPTERATRARETTPALSRAASRPAPSTRAEQREQVQSMMLDGAMRYAITRSSGDDSSAPIGGTVASLPDAPTLKDDGTVASLPDVPTLHDDVTVNLPDTPVPNGGTTVGREDALPLITIDLANLPDVAPQAGAPTGLRGADGRVMPFIASPAAPQTALLDTAAYSLPALPTEPHDAGIIADGTTEPGGGNDASATANATAAALQLIAQLPMSPPAMSLPDAPPLEGDVRPETRIATPGPGTRRSLPATPSDTLVEDHFDVPSRQIGIADQRSAPATPETPDTSDASVAATPDRASASTASGTPTPRTRATASGTVDVSAVERTLGKLAPEFRDRVERVIDRMRDEFGHSVTVVETWRSQPRQDALFAQGRTAPGPIVTWTKTSKHSQGLAADLMVDGQWQNPAGYAHLAQIARQEGLRTLGARDPGHVELPSETSVSGDTLDAVLSDLQGEAGDAARALRSNGNGENRSAAQGDALARVANVAQVARVATVASVASVAEVARPGERGSGAGAQPQADSVSPLAVSSTPMAGAIDLAGSMRVNAPVATVNLSDRIAHLMDLQATQGAKPLNSVLLRMDNTNGIDDQIRIDMRGTSVDARLGMTNAQQAASVTERIGELRDALERRGLTADGVRVQAGTPVRPTDSVNFTRGIAPVMELTAMRAAADSQSQQNAREQATRDQQQREAFTRAQERFTARSSSDDARHRSRREQPEDHR